VTGEHEASRSDSFAYDRGLTTTTLANVTAFERGEPLVNEVRADDVRPHEV
jgi:hypothetical protein